MLPFNDRSLTIMSSVSIYIPQIKPMHPHAERMMDSLAALGFQVGGTVQLFDGTGEPLTYRHMSIPLEKLDDLAEAGYAEMDTETFWEERP